MRENRPSGLMRGRCAGSDDDNYGLQSPLPHLPTLLNAPNRLKAELQTGALGLEFRIYAVGLVERAEPPEGGTPNRGSV